MDIKSEWKGDTGEFSHVIQEETLTFSARSVRRKLRSRAAVLTGAPSFSSSSSSLLPATRTVTLIAVRLS